VLLDDDEKEMGRSERRESLRFPRVIIIFFFFFLYVHIRGGEGIQTSDLHFMMHDPQPIDLPLGDRVIIIYWVAL